MSKFEYLMYLASCDVDHSRIYPNVLTLAVGEQGGFYCASKTKLTWSYNGNHKLPNDIVVDSTDNIIRIIKMTKGIVGTYECVGTDEKNFPFHAKGKLRLKHKSKNKLIMSCIFQIMLC